MSAAGLSEANGLPRLGAFEITSSLSVSGARFELGGAPAVFAMARQADGKLLVGGNLRAFANLPEGRVQWRNLIRVNADGTLDTAYRPQPSRPVGALVINSDGSAFVGNAPGPSYVGGSRANDVFKLDATTGALIPAFINSAEYRGRFL